MSLVIAGHVIDPEGTALVGVDVSIAFDNAASFADLAGTWDTQGRFGLSIPTDTFGAWSWLVPFSAVDPSDATCSITLPNGVRWSGVLPLSHNGTLSLKDLKDTYSWGLVSAPSASVVAVQGPPGASGASYPGVTSDGLTPGGLIVAGKLKLVGDGGFVAVVRNNNALTVQDQLNTVLAHMDSTGALYAVQVTAASLGAIGTVNNIGQVVITPQSGQSDPLLVITDDTGALFNCWFDTGNVLHARNGFSSFAGGVGLFGHAIPGAQPTMTLVTSTITDTNAKATISALIGIINGCGLANITES